MVFKYTFIFCHRTKQCWGCWDSLSTLVDEPAIHAHRQAVPIGLYSSNMIYQLKTENSKIWNTYTFGKIVEFFSANIAVMTGVVFFAGALSFGSLAMIAISTVQVAFTWPAVGKAEVTVATGITIRCCVFWTTLASSVRIKAITSGIEEVAVTCWKVIISNYGVWTSNFTIWEVFIAWT